MYDTAERVGAGSDSLCPRQARRHAGRQGLVAVLVMMLATIGFVAARNRFG